MANTYSLSTHSSVSGVEDSDAVDTSFSSSLNAETTKPSRLKKFKHGASAATRKTRQACGKYWSNAFTLATLKRKLPIIDWLPNYRPNCLKGDLIAGFTVGLTVIPQGMAYASLAGLDLQVSCNKRGTRLLKIFIMLEE